MRLYMIRRASDGMFLRKIEGSYTVRSGVDRHAWSKSPAYLLRTPDGVAMNLRKLCSEPFTWRGETPAGYGYSEIAYRNFDEAKMELFEVICLEVDLVKMSVVPASKFAQVDAVADIPLNRHEREAA
ncbi:MAG: hypothetical protein AAGF94_18130 [Pseudomonadota bacterium]